MDCEDLVAGRPTFFSIIPVRLIITKVAYKIMPQTIGLQCSLFHSLSSLMITLPMGFYHYEIMLFSSLVNYYYIYSLYRPNTIGLYCFTLNDQL